ncbi:MAG: hypothetical protein KAS32_17670, partial [Candidatus Peribacteraceae bacterium]|nr:hypothetical protein [Candidatus Peribacteraceae bacterium]
MNAEDRFREFLHKRGPAKAIKMCTWCGKYTIHQLNYCRNCGKITEWVKFKNWIHYSTYVLSRRHNKKHGGNCEGPPKGAFSHSL